MDRGVVIAGSGQAGFQAAASLRTSGYDGPITLVGEEIHLPYQRPPLSKGFLTGKQQAHHVTLRPAAFYADHRIELVAGERIVEIDRTRDEVKLSSGASISYGKLILALGASIRKLPVAGAELDGVCYLRTLDDSIEIKSRLAEASGIAVIGGGFIGLEIASAARALGKSVMVLETQPRLMARAVSPIVSGFYERLHRNHEVGLVFNARVSEISGEQIGAGRRVREIVLSDGTRIPADLVIAGIGVIPNSELARSAGLAVSNGIAVDEYLRTGDENIYAIGDCAEHPNHLTGERVRIESVQNAVDQAACVAAAIAGDAKPYREVPWFWTDQHNVKLQMAGLCTAHDRAAVRGNVESGKFSVFYFRDERLVAIDSINRPSDHMTGRRLLAGRTPLSPDQAADESVNLKALAQTS